MKKLGKGELTDKARIVGEVDEAKTELEEAVAEYNKVVEEAKGKVTAALEKLNGTIESANEWRSNINNEQDTYYDERSEKWQEGDAGSAYSDWKDNYSTEFDAVEIDLPDELEMPDVGVVEAMEELTDEP